MIEFFLEAYNLQDDATCDIQISSAGEIVFKPQYLSCIQEKRNWYWCQKQNQKFIILPTLTIIHPCIDIVSVKYVHDISRRVCNINQ